MKKTEILLTKAFAILLAFVLIWTMLINVANADTEDETNAGSSNINAEQEGNENEEHDGEGNKEEQEGEEKKEDGESDKKELEESNNSDAKKNEPVVEENLNEEPSEEQGENVGLRTLNLSSDNNSEEDIEEESGEEEEQQEDVVSHAAGVTDEMTTPEFWADRLGDEADEVLLTKEQIKELNQEIIDGSGTKVFDITEITEKKTQETRKQLLADDIDSTFGKFINNGRELYIGGELIDNKEYADGLKEAILTTGFDDDQVVQLYAVAVKRTELKNHPTSKPWGYDAPTDPDDEAVNSGLEVNEPFTIMAKCVIDGETFYWGYSYNCTGWVSANDLALFDSKAEWIDAWKVEVDGDNFIVVVQDEITLDPSDTATSNVALKIGTVLKLVPDKDMPETVDGRATYHNYVVYLPTRDENGKYVRSYALIPEHQNVSVGYLPMTQRNILNVAFSCLGNRYGWGGMLGAMDCTLYTKSIYKCFGLDIPRNTTWQQNIPKRKKDISELSDEQKEEELENVPVGTILFFSGHAMVYIGSIDGVSYVISDTGSLSDSVGENDVRKMYSVIVNPLTVRRGNGRTWLNNLSAMIVFKNMTRTRGTSSSANTGDANITYPDGITSDMSDAEYWKNLAEGLTEEIKSADDIKKLNDNMGTESKFDLNGKNFLVVTQDRIILEPSILDPDISEIELPLGTALELVPLDELPRNIAERGPWDNYVVYITVTNSEGKKEKRYALIPKHYSVNIGYLELTPENIIDVAYRCLGDSRKLMDNKEFVRSLYRCFGIEIPKSTDVSKDISSLSSAEKQKLLRNLPIGSTLYVDGEESIYLGADDDSIYTIGSMSRRINSIVLNKLDGKKISGVFDFTYERKEEAQASTSGSTEVVAVAGTTVKLKSPNTGDEIVLYISLLLISSIGIVVSYSKIKK